MNGAVLLDEVTVFINRFLSLSLVQGHMLALWIVHTHCKGAADVTPYLAITSPEKQSGKTRLLEVLDVLVANPWMTGRTTAAALVRKVEKGVTLLLDESDAAFQGEKEYAEALRGVLNSGHRRGGKASLCVGQGGNIEVKDFPVFGPKALAGIGKVPDTVADRSIPIRLKRKSPTEKVERFRRKLVDGEASILREKISTWARENVDTLKGAWPVLPDQLTDRQQDGIECLLAIADLAGDTWPARARWAACDIFGSAAAEDDSIRVRLLTDIRDVLHQAQDGRMLSADLVHALVEIEAAPWAEWSKGKPITPNGLARLLKPFEVAPRDIRTTTSRGKGYSLEAFEDAFTRYTRPSNRDNATTRMNSGPEPLLETRQPEPVTDAKNPSNPHEQCIVTAVTVAKPDSEPVDYDAFLLRQAEAACRQAGAVSIKTITETLMVPRPLAIQLIDQMEEMGLVGPATDGKPRPFLSAERVN
jgi:Protein of unknown function (DUF3631)